MEDEVADALLALPMRMISMIETTHAWFSWQFRALAVSGLAFLLLSSSSAADETRWLHCYYTSGGIWYYTLPFREYSGWKDDMQKSFYVRGEGPAYSWYAGTSGRTEAEAMEKREAGVEYKKAQGVKVLEWDWRADLDKEPATKASTTKAVGGIVIKDPARLAEPHEEVSARQMRVQREDAQRRIAARAEGIRQNAQVKAKIAALVAERAKRYPRQ